ncbi:MAG: BlaI/MecI/CopY family transcriptional regulator [Myxococcota bacterium]
MTDRLLTDAELELMSVLWAHGPCTAREAMAALPEGRAYTTVSTILRILVDKGFASAEPQGRAHVYGALVSRTDYRVRKLRSVVDGLFDGSALDLVRQLVRSEDLSASERDALRSFVEDLDDGSGE